MGSLFFSYSTSKPYPIPIIKFLTLKNGNLAAIRYDNIEILSGPNLEKIFTISPNLDQEDELILPPKIHSSLLHINDLIQVNNGNLILLLNYATKVILLSENNSYNFIQTINRGFKNKFYKILEIKNCLFCFEESTDFQEGKKEQIQIYYNNSNNNYTHSTTIKVENYIYDALYLSTNELVYFDGKVKFLNLDKFNRRNIDNTFYFDYDSIKNNNIICNLDNNHILIVDDKYFYIINILNYTIIKKISQIDNFLIKGLKNDSNGNIMVLKKYNYHIRICKGYNFKRMIYDYFAIYRINNNFNLEKKYEIKESDYKIESFHKYPDNQIVFQMSSRDDNSKYIKTLIVNL